MPLVDISKPADLDALRPGEIHLQVVKDEKDLPPEVRGHATTRVIRDPSGKILQVSHPDAGEMGNTSVADLQQAKAIDPQRLWRGVKVLCVLCFFAGLAASIAVTWVFRHLHWE